MIFFRNLSFMCSMIFVFSHMPAFAEPETILPSEKVKILSTVPEGYTIISDSIKLGQDLKKVTFVAYMDNTHQIVRYNNASSPVYYVIQAGMPIFSPEKNRHAFIGYKQKSGACTVVIEGKPGPVFDNADSLRFSPDDSRYAYRAVKGDKQCVVVDGKPGNWYRGIPIKNNMSFSPDSSNFAYVALKEEGCVLVLNGKEQSETFNFIDDVVFSLDSRHLAYKGRIEKKKTSEKWCVVADGNKHAVYDFIFDLIYSRDSKHLAYVAAKDRAMTLVHDGKEMEYRQHYGLPVFSSNSESFAYSFVDNNKFYFVLNGKKGPAYDNIYKFYFSPDSSRHAYIASRNKKWYCIVDGKETGGYKQIDAFKFSPDSTRYAFGAVTDDKKGLIITDQSTSKAYMSVGEPYFSPDSRHFVHRIRRESDGRLTTLLDGKEFGDYYNGIGEYQFSKDSNHLTYHALINLAEKSVLVVDGKEHCQEHNFKIIGDPHFSPDNDHIAYHVRAGENKWKLVVDGHVLENTYGGFFKGTPIIFDSPDHFHTLALNEEGTEFIGIDVKIPKNIKLQTELSKVGK